MLVGKSDDPGLIAGTHVTGGEKTHGNRHLVSTAFMACVHLRPKQTDQQESKEM